MINEIYESALKKVKDRIWIISDLQQSELEKSEFCLSVAIRDLNDLNTRINGIWYLGDAIEGTELAVLNEMCIMQKEKLTKFDVPLFYVLGNHDFDYFVGNQDKNLPFGIPFYDTVKNTESWRSTNAIEDSFFTSIMGDYLVVFFSDHADSNGAWYTSHGEVKGSKSKYPYDEKMYDPIRKRMEEWNGPVITASHYSFAGGTRPSNLLGGLMPVPKNVVAHFYGHAHIGDMVWAGKDRYKKISFMDDHAIPQFNVSSLENIRGSSIRSVLLNIYWDNSLGVFFRDHAQKTWTECYFRDVW